MTSTSSPARQEPLRAFLERPASRFRIPTIFAVKHKSGALSAAQAATFENPPTSRDGATSLPRATAMEVFA
jgi:hypothetical protein